MKEVWNPWFTRLDPWSGQTLPLERVAWLKLCGIPLHLFEYDIMAQVGDKFGKVLFVPKSFEEDRDLSIVRVGVLVGTSSRINDVVVLKWKDRSFRILVEEDLEDWIPDCLGRDPDSEDGLSSESSPTDGMQVSGSGEFEEGQGSGNEGVAEKTPGVVDSNPHAAQPPVHGEKVTCGVYNNEEREDCFLDGQDCPLGSKEVGQLLLGVLKVGQEKVWVGPRGELIWGKEG
ncbi:hypothetical protein Hdeb2414_s0138g00810031 [Helianthus debilis subsp. tardiflorus]